MFCERFTTISFGHKPIYIIADDHCIQYVGTQVPSPMGLLRSDRHPLLQQAATELSEYFSGQRQQLSFAIGCTAPPFIHAFYTQAFQIPYGACVDAEIIAQSIGYPHSVHAIDVLCRANPLCARIPTHRIRPSDGRSREIDLALRQMERRFAAP